MSLRGLNNERHPNTIREYLDRYPEDDPFGEPYDPFPQRGWTASSMGIGWTPAGHDRAGPCPGLVTRESERPEEPSSVGRSDSTSSDVIEPGGSRAGLQ